MNEQQLLSEPKDFSLQKDDKPDLKKLEAICALVAGREDGHAEAFITAYQLFSQRVKEKIRQQYLSHFRVALESLLREEFANPHFSIILRPRDKSQGNPQLRKEDFKAQVRFYGHRDYAIIRYNPHMDEMQLRVVLAHEMGHLFAAYLASAGEQPEDYNTEPMATFIGVLAIIDKNDFYCHKAKDYQHKHIDDIVSDFAFLHPQFANTTSPN